MTELLLKDSTNDQIKAHARSKGYEFDDFDCDELRNPTLPSPTETLEDAVQDYIYAYICPYGEDN